MYYKVKIWSSGFWETIEKKTIRLKNNPSFALGLFSTGFPGVGGASLGCFHWFLLGDHVRVPEISAGSGPSRMTASRLSGSKRKASRQFSSASANNDKPSWTPQKIERKADQKKHGILQQYLMKCISLMVDDFKKSISLYNKNNLNMYT